MLNRDQRPDLTRTTRGRRPPSRVERRGAARAGDFSPGRRTRVHGTSRPRPRCRGGARSGSAELARDGAGVCLMRWQQEGWGAGEWVAMSLVMFLVWAAAVMNTVLSHGHEQRARIGGLQPRGTVEVPQLEDLRIASPDHVPATRRTVAGADRGHGPRCSFSTRDGTGLGGHAGVNEGLRRNGFKGTRSASPTRRARLFRVHWAHRPCPSHAALSTRSRCSVLMPEPRGGPRRRQQVCVSLGAGAPSHRCSGKAVNALRARAAACSDWWQEAPVELGLSSARERRGCLRSSWSTSLSKSGLGMCTRPRCGGAVLGQGRRSWF